MDNYNILIITDYLYPVLSANSEIAYRIAQVLQFGFGCEISVLGFEVNKYKSTQSIENIFHTIRLESFNAQSDSLKKYNNKFYRFLQYVKHPIKYRNVIYSRLTKKDYDIINYKNTIKKALKMKPYDCVIAFGMPFYSFLALLKIKTNIPIVLYKLDPWANLYFFKQIRNKVLIEEKKCVCKASAIITTDLLKNESYNYYSDDTISKITSLEFPNIVKVEGETDVTIFEKDKINCVFCGSLYKTIRNPQYTFDLFKNLNQEVVFHIFGRLKEGLSLSEYMSENIIYHGVVPSDKALAYMQAADILINIGNTENNLLPSKILTYISMGKPILNIIKLSNCPTLKYTKKYPLALDILETEEVKKEDIERVRNFIIENKGKEIPFETVEKLYYDCTPEYVGSKVYEIIEKVVNENK